MLPLISRVLGSLRRKLRVDELTLWYRSAGADPAAAAMLFGIANAAAGALIEPIEELFRIKERDIRTDISFTDIEPTVYVQVRLSVSFGILLIIALRGYAQYRRIRKSEDPEDREES